MILCKCLIFILCFVGAVSCTEIKYRRIDLLTTPYEANVKHYLHVLGGDVNAQDSGARTGLIFAAIYGRLASAKMLIDAGADPYIQDNAGFTAMAYAFMSMSENRSDLINYFKSQGININACDTYGQSILHWLVNDYESDKTAHSYGTPMYRRDLETIEDALKFGAYVDVGNIEGNTPLFIGASKGYTEVVELLLKWGANPKIANSKGETAFDVASARGFSEISEVLKRAMRD